MHRALALLGLLLVPVVPAMEAAPPTLADEIAAALAQWNGGVLPERLGSAPGLEDVPTAEVLALLANAAAPTPAVEDVGVGTRVEDGGCPNVALVVIRLRGGTGDPLRVAAGAEGGARTCGPPPNYHSSWVRGYVGAFVQFDAEPDPYDPWRAYATAQTWTVHEAGATLGPLDHVRLAAAEVDIGQYWYGWEGSIYLVYASEGTIAVTDRALPSVGRRV